MDVQDLFDRIAEVNPERLEAYHRMFDRILLYTLASNVIPQDRIDHIIKLADRIVKKTIDTDSNKQTNYLHGSKDGRQTRMESQINDNEYDGEALRLDYLKTWALVKDIVKGNMQRPLDNDSSRSD